MSEERLKAIHGALLGISQELDGIKSSKEEEFFDLSIEQTEGEIGKRINDDIEFLSEAIKGIENAMESIEEMKPDITS